MTTLPASETPRAGPHEAITGFRRGFAAAWVSVFAYVLFGLYIGIGALAHDVGFSVWWAIASTLLIWAGPAQVILLSTLGSGSTLVQAALAVTLSGIRLLPMVVALLPLIRTPSTKMRHLALPAHFTAVSMWVEALRIVPSLPREQRIGFCNGLGVGLLCSAASATVAGFYLAASLPVLFGAAVLFLTPMSFLVSTARNSRQLVDWLSLGFGLVLAPVFAYFKFELDLLMAGLTAGTLAYAVHRVRMLLR